MLNTCSALVGNEWKIIVTRKLNHKKKKKSSKITSLNEKRKNVFDFK